MIKFYTILAAFVLASLNPAFAHNDMMNSSDTNDVSTSECKPIVSACKKAGFSKQVKGKAFWRDCMHPLLLGKSVTNVSVDSSKISACRSQKIAKMQTELEQLQQVKDQAQ